MRSVLRGEFKLVLSSVTLPVNDVCSTATPVTTGASVVGNLSFATSDENQVINATDCSGSSLEAQQPGLWYSFQGTGGVVWLNTCFPGSTITALSVYKGASCGIATLQCVFGIHSPCTFREKAAFRTEIGVTYRVLVRHWGGSVDTFRLEISSIERPSNDVCATATPITVDSGNTFAGNLTFATSDVDQVLNGDACSRYELQDDKPGVWYKFQGTGGWVWINACLPELRVTAYSAVSVYKGTCGAATLQCVVGFPSCFVVAGKQVFHTDLDTTYYVLIRYWTGTIGAFRFEISSIVHPSNDECSGAEPITIGSSVVGNLTFATSDEDQVLNGRACFGTFIKPFFQGLWYTFQGAGSRIIAFTCFPWSTRMSISVFNGSCGIGSLQCVAGYADPCSNGAKFWFQTEIGTTYYILASIWYNSPGTFELLLSNIIPVLPGNEEVNDACNLAIPLEIGSFILGNTSLARLNQGEVPSDCVVNNAIDQRPGVWYSFHGTGGDVAVNTCSPGLMKVHLSVYTGTCSNSAAALQCMNGSHDPCVLPRFTFKTNFGTKYYLLVRPAFTSFNPPTFELFLYNESNSLTLPPPQGSPITAPVPAPITAPSTPTMAPVKTPSKSPTKTPTKAPTKAPTKSPTMAPTTAPAIPDAPVEAPITAPIAPTALPPSTIHRKCGPFGFRFVCPLTRCGLFGRLLGLCKRKDHAVRFH